MDKDELDREIKNNFNQRMKFIEEYAEWVKKTPNEVWSGQQKRFIDEVLKSADRIARKGIKVE